MVRWEQLPAAIAPDQEYDKAGCFSGSAIEADGKHVLVYTGVTRVKQADGSEQERQNQCIAFGEDVYKRQLLDWDADRNCVSKEGWT